MMLDVVGESIAAHSRNFAGVRHDLVTHLRSVARLAAGFAESFGAREVDYYAGLFHDVGKFRDVFQEYLRRCELNPDGRTRGPDHKAAGSVLAREVLGGLLAMTIQGHHGGLQSPTQFSSWLAEREKDSDVMCSKPRIR